MSNSIADMQAHAEQLCRDHDIDWRANCRRSDRSYALIDLRNIYTAPIRGVVTYGTVMHEIGHILGRYQTSHRVLVRENWAWVWARANALIWTPSVERSAQRALGWYTPRAAKIDATQARERAEWSRVVP
jgi:hypothetical protein